MREITERLRVAASDVRAVVRHGRSVPLLHERVWIPTQDLSRALAFDPTSGSKRVLDGDWDLQWRPIESVSHVRQALAHWRDGLSWEESGAYDDLLSAIERSGGVHAGCRTKDDVIRRYARLDEVFATVRAEGRLRTQRELRARAIRERGGIIVHADRDAQPIFNGWGGCHRIAMAMVLGLPVIPAAIALVHRQALPIWRTQLLATSDSPRR